MRRGALLRRAARSSTFTSVTFAGAATTLRDVPDDGDVDMLAVARTLYEVDYSYMLMPDHMPTHPDDPGGSQAFAFGYGYIKGLLQAIGTS